MLLHTHVIPTAIGVAHGLTSVPAGHSPAVCSGLCKADYYPSLRRILCPYGGHVAKTVRVWLEWLSTQVRVCGDVAGTGVNSPVVFGVNQAWGGGHHQGACLTPWKVINLPGPRHGCAHDATTTCAIRGQQHNEYNHNVWNGLTLLFCALTRAPSLQDLCRPAHEGFHTCCCQTGGTRCTSCDSCQHVRLSS